ncbi:MAG TPA: hypothetical protein VGN00_13285 [Puia sp.]|jgi:hypothetical protein
MQRYNTKTHLGSYTITTQLVKKITGFLSDTLPAMLSTDLSVLPAEESTALTIIYSDHAVRYPRVSEYRHDPFKGEIQGLRMELSHLVKFSDATKAIVVNLSFNKEKEDNYLYMALQDDNAEKELPAIESQLLSLLEKFKNNHHLIFRSQWFTPIIFLTGGLFGSLTFLTHAQPMRSLYAMLFGICIYLFVFPYIKGYSTFDSNRQKNWNVFFKWFTASVAVSVLAIIFF